MSKTNGPKRIRELLAKPGIVRSLGAHDVFTALTPTDLLPRARTIARLGRQALLSGSAPPVHALAPRYLRASIPEERREAACAGS